MEPRTHQSVEVEIVRRVHLTEQQRHAVADEAVLAHHGVRNITLETGDGARGWDRQQPYDVILLTGSTQILPDPDTVLEVKEAVALAIEGLQPPGGAGR